MNAVDIPTDEGGKRGGSGTERRCLEGTEEIKALSDAS